MRKGNNRYVFWVFFATIFVGLGSMSIKSVVAEVLQTLPIEQEDITPPAAPVELKAMDTRRGGSIRLNWQSLADTDMAGYNIYRTSNISTNLEQSTAKETEAILASEVVEKSVTESPTPELQTPGSPTPEQEVPEIQNPEPPAKEANPQTPEPQTDTKKPKRLNPELIQENSYLDTGLKDGEEYSYYVTAVDLSGNESVASELVTVVPTHDVTPPPVPQKLQVWDLGVGKRVLVEWSGVSASDFEGYNLYRMEKGVWTKLNDSPLSETSFEDTKVVNGTVYRYKVTSQDDVGNESTSIDPVVGWGTNKNAKVVWQFGETGRDGKGEAQLYAPYGLDLTAERTILVADSHNGRVMETDPLGNILWQYRGNLIEPVKVKSINDNEVLIVDAEGSSVRLVQKDTNEVKWSYGKGKRRHGKSSGELNNPNDASILSSGNILIADTGNGRVIEVNSEGRIVWTSESPSFKTELRLPIAVQLVGENLLITDAGSHKVIEADRKGNILWVHGTGKAGRGEAELDYPSQSFRLPNRNTLIVDSMNYRIVEVSTEGFVVWQFGDWAKTDLLFEPGGVAWSADNNYIYIADQHNHRIVEVDH